jgi:hypothetical protein
MNSTEVSSSAGITHDKHFHVVHQKNNGGSGTMSTVKGSDAGGRSFGNNPEESFSITGSNKNPDRDRAKYGNERSFDSKFTRINLLGSLCLGATQKIVPSEKH